MAPATRLSGRTEIGRINLIRLSHPRFHVRNKHVDHDGRDIEIKRQRAMLEERDAVIADRDVKIERLTRELDLLRKEFERFIRGRRSPDLSVPDGQGLLFPDSAADTAEGDSSPECDSEEGDDEDGEQDEKPPPKREEEKGTRRGRRIDTTGLERRKQVHELPEAERVCPVTKLTLVPVDVKVTEELDYERARLVVIEHHQIIYGLSPEDARERQADQITAPAPRPPVLNCLASATLLAWLLVQKYANHLPLYRQTNIFGREGLRLPRQTLCDWVLRAAEALEPIVEHMLAEVRAGPVLQIDDTPVRCQGGRGEPNFQARLWAFVNPKGQGVVFRFTPGRASDTLADELEGFLGTLLGDGYQGNKAAAELVFNRLREVDEGVERILLAGCWAHVVRKFRDAKIEDAATSELFRADLRLLYDIEAEAREEELADESQRAAVTLRLRKEKSVPIVIRILRRTSRMRECFDSAGLIGKAMGYVRGQRSALIRFLRDGEVPIDNNACERAIRPIAVGRKNWLFAGSMRGGRAAAVAYTLLESCKHAGVDPVEYVADVLARVTDQSPDEMGDLVPANWTRLKGPAPRADLAMAGA